MIKNTRSYQAKFAAVARHMHHAFARHGDDEAGTGETAETAAVTTEPLQLKSGASQATVLLPGPLGKSSRGCDQVRYCVPVARSRGVTRCRGLSASPPSPNSSPSIGPWPGHRVLVSSGSLLQPCCVTLLGNVAARRQWQRQAILARLWRRLLVLVCVIKVHCSLLATDWCGGHFCFGDMQRGSLEGHTKLTEGTFRQRTTTQSKKKVTGRSSLAPIRK
jgi:hypothetical protein